MNSGHNYYTYYYHAQYTSANVRLILKYVFSPILSIFLFSWRYHAQERLENAACSFSSTRTMLHSPEEIMPIAILNSSVQAPQLSPA